MAAAIDHETAIAEARFVADGDGGNAPAGVRNGMLAVNLHGEQLIECLDGIEETGESGCLHDRFRCADFKGVGLFAQALVQHEQETFGLAFRHDGVQTGREGYGIGLDPAGELGNDFAAARVKGGISVEGHTGYFKRAFAQLNGLGVGNQVEHRFSLGGQAQADQCGGKQSDNSFHSLHRFNKSSQDTKNLVNKKTDDATSDN